MSYIEYQKYKGWVSISSIALCVVVQPVILPILPIKEASAFIGVQNLKFSSLTQTQKATFPKAIKFNEFSLNLTDDILTQIYKKSDVSKQSQNKEAKDRLKDIEKEIANLKEKTREIELKWKNEKETVSEIREIKKELELL